MCLLFVIVAGLCPSRDYFLSDFKTLDQEKPLCQMEQMTQSLNYTAACLLFTTHRRELPHPYRSAQALSQESSSLLEDHGKFEVNFFLSLWSEICCNKYESRLGGLQSSRPVCLWCVIHSWIWFFFPLGTLVMMTCQQFKCRKKIKIIEMFPHKILSSRSSSVRLQIAQA